MAGFTTRQLIRKRLRKIEQDREAHRHTYLDMMKCATIRGVRHRELIDAHVGLGPTVYCDVVAGPCQCGRYHPHEGQAEIGVERSAWREELGLAKRKRRIQPGLKQRARRRKKA